MINDHSRKSNPATKGMIWAVSYQLSFLWRHSRSGVHPRFWLLLATFKRNVDFLGFTRPALHSSHNGCFARAATKAGPHADHKTNENQATNQLHENLQPPNRNRS